MRAESSSCNPIRPHYAFVQFQQIEDSKKAMNAIRQEFWNDNLHYKSKTLRDELRRRGGRNVERKEEEQQENETRD